MACFEKELLAIIWATKYFSPYLCGLKFNIITDHKPLQWLFSLKDPNSKLTLWCIRLEEFDYNIIYKKRKLNTNADSFSRVEIHTKETATVSDENQKLIQNIYKNPEKSRNTHFHNILRELSISSNQRDVDNISTQVQPDDEDRNIDVTDEPEQYTVNLPQPDTANHTIIQTQTKVP